MWRQLVAGSALALVLVGCASAREPAPAPTSETTTGHHGAYAECLAQHGITTPPLGPGAPPGVDAATWEAAQQACADKAPGPAGS